MRERTDNVSAILIGAVIILSIALVVVSFTYAIKPNSATKTIPTLPANASLMVKLYAPVYSVENFVITLSRNGYSESENFKLGPEIYQLNKSPIKGENIATIPIAVNSISQLNNTVIIPDNGTRVLFGGLIPYSNYTVEVNGSESPYCFPGLACPLFILKLQHLYRIRTGAPGSTSNISISLYPSGENINPNPASCSFEPLLYYNASEEVKCYDNSRLLNFELLSVNKNYTVTGIAYHYPLPFYNSSEYISKETFGIGKAVDLECSGYIAYLSATNYSQQYAIFKMVKLRPIPCPAAS